VQQCFALSYAPRRVPLVCQVPVKKLVR
jgi:hypothetical protein